MSTPSAARAVGTVQVTGAGVVLHEPVLGAARYPDGSLLVVTLRTFTRATVPGDPMTWVYRTRPYIGPGEWAEVWTCPQALLDFIVTNSVGATGKVSNRRVEVVDYATVVPDQKIHLDPRRDKDSW